MWLMPYGSFDPRTVGFYRAIGTAVLLEIILMKFIKFPPEEKKN
jgi:hypothetical protein